MVRDEHEMLELLRFELKFLENGGYGRSSRTPWRPPFIFEDSPSCLNLGDHWATSRAEAGTRTHPCSECLLMKFVPEELQNENSPCRFIPLDENGKTIDYFYRCGTQPELEDALDGWLRKQISLFEEQREAAPEAEHSSEIDPLRRQQWLALAGNLYLLGNLHCEIHDYVVAYALYSRALAVAEKVATIEDNGRWLVERIRKNQQAVSEILNRRRKQGGGGASRVGRAANGGSINFITQLDDKIAAKQPRGSNPDTRRASW